MRMTWKEMIPWGMAAVRAGLGPVLIAGAACSWNGTTLAGMVVAALLSDVFDGILARRWGCDTAAVRLFDSMADTFFYLCVGWALWMRCPEIWRANMGLFVTVIGLEVFRFGLDFWKYGKPASYHSYLAKTWGLTLAIAVVAAFARESDGWMMTLSLGLGVVCLLEGILMSLMLPEWSRDVKTLAAAWRLREMQLRQRAPEARREMFRADAWRGGAVLLVLAVVGMRPAEAQDGGAIEYRGGTLREVTVGTGGRLDQSGATVLVLHFDGVNGAMGLQVSIPYEAIQRFNYHSEVRHHLGVLPAIAAGLVAARQRRNVFSITFGDEAGVVQVVEFEVEKSEPGPLLQILRMKAAQACGGNQAQCGGLEQ